MTSRKGISAPVVVAIITILIAAVAAGAAFYMTTPSNSFNNTNNQTYQQTNLPNVPSGTYSCNNINMNDSGPNNVSPTYMICDTPTYHVECIMINPGYNSATMSCTWSPK